MPSRSAPPEAAHPPIRLRLHGPGAPLLRLCHLGRVQALLDGHTSWASGRSRRALGRMLAGSEAAVSAWQGERLVGFGRATSDGVFRATLWDVVVLEGLRGQGLGRQLVHRLLEAPALREVERVYLMTSRGAPFYERLGFTRVDDQSLMRKG